jgi:hypothetical protein
MLQTSFQSPKTTRPTPNALTANQMCLPLVQAPFATNAGFDDSHLGTTGLAIAIRYILMSYRFAGNSDRSRVSVIRSTTSRKSPRPGPVYHSFAFRRTVALQPTTAKTLQPAGIDAGIQQGSPDDDDQEAVDKGRFLAVGFYPGSLFRSSFCPSSAHNALFLPGLRRQKRAA